MNQPMRFNPMRDLKKMPLIKFHAGLRFALITGTLMLLVVPAMLQAQVSSNEINYFSRCRDISDNQARLACYDNLYDRAVGAVRPRSNTDRMLEENRRMREELARIRQQTGAAPTVGRSQDDGSTERYQAPRRVENYGRTARPPASNQVEDFGKKTTRVVKDDNGNEILFDRIAALKKSPDGWIITLESGQVWKQMVNKRYNLRTGQVVKLSPTIWGNAYRLSEEKLGGFIQVKRIQ